MKIRDWLLASLFILAWSANFTVTKIGISNMPPMLLASVRYLLVAFPVIFFVKRPRVAWYYLAGYAMTIGVGVLTCLVYAMHIGMPAGLSSVIMQSSSFFTILLAMLVFHEKIHRHQLAGSIIAFSGLSLIGLSAGNAGEASIPLTAILLTIAAALFWSLATLIVKAAANRASRAAQKIDMLGLVAWTALIPPLPLLLAALTMDSPDELINALIHINPTAIASILFLAWCSTLLGTSAWNNLLSKYDTGKVAPLSLLVPVFGLLIARIVLSEMLSTLQWLGSLLIVAGLVVFNLGFRPDRTLKDRFSSKY